ncbi:hypothetical protein [Streptomyces sp. enrichment culture]|uniref:hypothetical protein n=1 Tax=Streptomyces sp. enrichment culture TaxID=1795815 RepID=UPI003F562407
MARLQILELPEGNGDDRPPFILVVDECVPQRIALGATAAFGDYWQDLADKIGARGVIVTPETIDIPANDTSGYLRDDVRNDVTVKLGDQPIAWSQADETQAQTTHSGEPKKPPSGCTTPPSQAAPPTGAPASPAGHPAAASNEQPRSRRRP